MGGVGNDGGDISRFLVDGGIGMGRERLKLGLGGGIGDKVSPSLLGVKVPDWLFD